MTHLRPLTPNPCNLSHVEAVGSSRLQEHASLPLLPATENWPSCRCRLPLKLASKLYSHTTAPDSLRRKETILEIPLVEDVLNTAE